MKESELIKKALAVPASLTPVEIKQLATIAAKYKAEVEESGSFW